MKIDTFPKAIAEIFPEALNIVELGVYKGVGSKRWRKAYPEARLVLVDAWKHLWDSGPMMKRNDDDAFEKIYNRVRKHFRNDTNIEFIRAKTEDAAELFSGTADIVHVDADHSYDSCVADIFAWYDKVRPGGWITGHDWKKKSVRRAVYDSFGREPFVWRSNYWMIRK